jgi:hypothetical protein
MNMRKITSMTMLISLVILILNSVVLYVVPEGRVAYWADWRFWGLTKSQWGDQHITVGVLFLIAGFLHIYYNWKPILAYMKNKAREVKVFTGSFNVALAVTAVFVVGTYFMIPPMSTILDISSHFKDAGSEKYGEPPYGHAELSSLKMFSKKEGLDPVKSVELLKAAGYEVTGAQDTIKDIAGRKGVAPQKVYEIIKAAKVAAPAAAGGAVSFPDAPEAGWGKKKLSEICERYGLKEERIIHKLSDQGISADGESTIHEIAEANNLEPMGLFETIHGIVAGSGK